MAAAPPEKIGDYPVEKLLGSGGMASVYQVRDPASGQSVACKVMSEHLSDEVDRLRFEREFRLATRFDHPNLIKVFEMGYWQNSPFYTMELLSGQDLRAYMQDLSMRMEWDEWLGVLGLVGGQMLAGLEYIHNKQVVHRDLKPENIHVDRQGRVRFLDFGLARDVGGEARFTKTGVIVGTPAYMAPEQLGVGEVDARTDLFAVGVIIYELLSGCYPHPGPDMRTIIFHLISQPPEPLVTYGGIPPALHRLVMRLLESDAAARPAGCQETLAEWLEIFPHVQLTRSEGKRELFRSAFQGQAQAVEAANGLLSRRRGILVARGPSGSGKSRWLEEVGRQGVLAYWEVAQARCAATTGIPFGPWADILRGAFEGGLPAEMEPHRSTLANLLPELGEAVHLEEAGKLRLFRCVYHALSRRNPGLMILLDDLEELDQGSRELLSYLLRAELPGLVVAATSSAPFEKYPSVELVPFTTENTLAVVESMLGQRVSSSVAEALYLSCRGNALLLSEIVKGAFVGGDFVMERGQIELRAGCVLPETLEQALDRRLRTMDPALIPMLSWLAAWQGRAEFSELSHNFFGGVAKTQEELIDQLEALVRHQLVVREGRGYFLLPQVSRVVLAALTPELRRDLHQQMAKRLAGSERVPHERVGHHWLAAQQPAAAREPLLAAAQGQAALYNYGRALELYKQVEELPGPPVDGLQRLKAEALLGWHQPEPAYELFKALNEADPQLDLLLKMGECQWYLGRFQRSYQLLAGGVKLPSENPSLRFWFWWDWLRLRAGRPGGFPGGGKLPRWLRRALFWMRPKGWQVDYYFLRMWERPGGAREIAAHEALLHGLAFLVGPWPDLVRARRLLLRAGELSTSLAASGFQAELLSDIGFYLSLAGAREGLELLKQARARGEQFGAVLPLLESTARLTQLNRLAGRIGQAQQWAGELLQLVRHAQDPIELLKYHTQQSILHSICAEKERADEHLAALAGRGDIPRVKLDESLARGYAHLLSKQKPEVQALAVTGLDRLLALELELVRVFAKESSPAYLLKVSREAFPVFQCVALRLTGKLEDALALARKHDFPLEEGLTLTALSRKRNQPELVNMARAALERTQLPGSVAEKVLRGGGPLD
ncbi:MAG: protein kinase [Vulcanimicrobiota bacterium]